METQTAQVVQQGKILSEIDAEAASCGGAALKVETIWPEEQRKRLMAFLATTEPAWKDEDHPELVELGTYGWVRCQREKNWRRPR